MLNKTFLKITTGALAALAIAASGAVLAQSQDRDAAERTGAQKEQTRAGAALDRRPAASTTFGVAYNFESLNGLSGGQFRLHYDPKQVQVSSTANCLSEIPESHRGEFSACNHVADRHFIQFITMDLGNNRPIGSDLLGWVEFRTVGRVKDLNSVIRIDDVRLAGPDGLRLGEAPRGAGVEFTIIDL